MESVKACLVAAAGTILGGEVIAGRKFQGTNSAGTLRPSFMLMGFPVRLALGEGAPRLVLSGIAVSPTRLVRSSILGVLRVSSGMRGRFNGAGLIYRGSTGASK